MQVLSGRLAGLHQVSLLHTKQATLALLLQPGQVMPVQLQESDQPT